MYVVILALLVISLRYHEQGVGAVNTVLVPPRGGLYQVGSTVQLSCTVDSVNGSAILLWVEYQTEPTGNNICTITTQGTWCINLPRFELTNTTSVTTSGGSTITYTLTISAAVLADGGYYRCYFVESFTPQPVAIITIFDALVITVPPTSLLFAATPVSCKVTYTSARYYTLSPDVKPVVSLLVASAGVLAVSTDALVPDQTATTVTLTLAADVTFVPSQVPATATCTIGLPNQHNFTLSVPFDIPYPVRNLTIHPHPIDGSYVVNDVIACSANGNPAPYMYWSGLRDPLANILPTLPPPSIGGGGGGGSSSTTSLLRLTQAWQGQSFTLTCTASNSPSTGNGTLTYTLNTSVTFTVEDPDKGIHVVPSGANKVKVKVMTSSSALYVGLIFAVQLTFHCRIRLPRPTCID